MFSNLLEEALEAWTDAREGVIAEVENLPAERFDFRPTPDVRDVAELVRHILEVSLMMAGELTREETNLRRLPWPELLALHAGGVADLTAKPELLDALRTTLDEGRARFRTAGELHMLQLIERFDGLRGTRLAWLHHGIAQEMYHRGQLALYARLMGIEPALTKRIRGVG
ncbi:MAG: DinB family protein [Gemmatimonadota bacterium]